jgi:hypothetical protein
MSNMTTHQHSDRRTDPLDDLTTQLLECGALLSQMISHMVQWQAAGKSAPDAAPIPDVAHQLIRDVIGRLTHNHPAAEISAAAVIVGEATKVIGDEIFFMSSDMN